MKFKTYSESKEQILSGAVSCVELVNYFTAERPSHPTPDRGRGWNTGLRL